MTMARRILYFVRHGETDWNRDRRLQGQHDIPLNDVGRAQAARCGEVLAGLFARTGRSVDAFDFVSSPLCRARETMERVRASLGLLPHDYRVDRRLAELSFGRWEGLTYAELQEQDPDLLAIAVRSRDKWDFAPPGGESLAQLSERVRAWHQGVARDTVVVAHGGVARTLIAHFGIKEPGIASAGEVAQGAVYEFAENHFRRYE